MSDAMQLDRVLDNKTLRHGEGKHIAAHLRDASNAYGNSAVTQHIFSAVERESLPPRILITWLNINRESKVLLACMRQQFSASARKRAIQLLPKLSTIDGLEDFWSAAGQTDGVVHLLKSLSCYDVKLLCHTLGLLGTKDSHIDGIRRRVTDLYRALNMAETNADSRPLQEYYQQLLPACEEACVAEQVGLTRGDLPRSALMIRAHPALFQRLVLASLDDPEAKLNFDPTTLFTDTPWKSTCLKLPDRKSFTAEILRRTQDAQAGSKFSVLSNAFLSSLLRQTGTHKGSLHPEAPELVEAIVQHLKQRNKINTETVKLYADIWSRSPDRYEEGLVSIIKSSKIDQDDVHTIIRQLPQSVRLKFIRLAYAHSPLIGVDIDSVEDIGRQRKPLNSALLLVLPRDEAIATYDKYELAYGSGEFLTRYSKSAELLQIILLQHTPRGLTVAEQAIHKKMKETVSERDQHARAELASTVLEYAVASGHLRLLQDALRWARRFDRDHHAVTKIYGSNWLQSSMAELLTAIPENFEGLDSKSLEASVHQANETIEMLIDTACKATSEPSYHPYTWVGIFNMLAIVVAGRIACLPQLQKALRLTDDTVYNAVWQQTLDMSLKLEERLTAPRFRQYRSTMRFWQQVSTSDVKFNNARSRGRQDSQTFSILPDLMTPSTALFIDRLCKGRYELHERVRASNVAVEPHEGIWVAGLSLKHLVPFKLGKTTSTAQLPFLLSRAAKTVFVSRDIALIPAPLNELNEPVHIDDVEAESFTFATKILIASRPTRVERHGMMMAAFNHIVSVTEALFNSSRDARRYWRDVLIADYNDAPLALTQGPWRKDLRMDLLPEDHGAQLSEWDPQPEKPLVLNRKPLLVDVLAGGEPYLAPYVPSGGITPRVYIRSPEQFQLMTDLYSIDRNVSALERESIIAMALLYVDAHHKLGSQLLRAPFPTAEDARFPAVYLAHEFLEKCPTHAERSANHILQAHRSDLPVSLVLKLVDSLQAAADPSEEDHSALTCAFRLLNTVVDSDRPGAAAEVIVRSIFDDPQHSSWHRWILRPRLFNNLPPDSALQLIQRLAHEIVARLERSAALAGTTDKTSAAGVKITTVKLFIELLTSTKCLGFEDVIGTLRSILRVTRHVDIRIAVIQQLSFLLQNTQDRVMQAGIIDTLAQVVPIASEFDERTPMTETVWADVVNSRSIEMDAKNQKGELPDTMTALMSIEQHLRQPEQIEVRKALLRRIMLPLLHHSIKNNQRWLSIWLPSLNLENKAIDSIPAMPIQKQLLKQLVSTCDDILDDDTFSLFDNYVHATINPPPIIVEVTNKLQKAPKPIRESNGARHWMATWDYAATSWVDVACSALRNMNDRTDAQMEMGQQRWRRYAALYLQAGSRHDAARDSHAFILAPPGVNSGEQMNAAWMKWCRPLLVEYVDKITQLRSPAWQENRERSPDTLPDTFTLEMRLLPYPDLPYHQGEAQKCKMFVKSIIDHLQTISAGQPYHRRWPQLKQAVTRLRATRYEPPVGIELGDIDTDALRNPSLVDHLRVELAAELLGNILSQGPKHSNAVWYPGVKAMAMRWRDGPVEAVREHGKRLLNSSG